MNIKHFARRVLISAGLSSGQPPIVEQPFTRQSVLNGIVAARQIQHYERVTSLAEIEFGVFSQWGEDGIIEWLVHHNGAMPKSFIEFGVENYTESNTRFLLYHRNWRGMVIDGSASNIDYIRNDAVYWRHNLIAKFAFIDRDNINGLLTEAGFGGEIGILSVDIDGNDYWVWEAINSIDPHIVIVEYNASFGDLLPLAVPYDPNFFRTDKHYSNLYFGASIAAYDYLASKKGYTRLGSNRAGNNLFYIRNDRLPRLADRIADTSGCHASFRESRGKDGRLTYVEAPDRGNLLAHSPVVDVTSGRTAALGDLGPLYSARWLAAMAGRLP